MPADRPMPPLPKIPRTWNEAAHVLRRDEQPENYGHKHCPWCEAAKAKEAADA